MRWLGSVALVGWVLAAGAAPSRAESRAAAQAQSLIAGLDYDDARRLLAGADGEDPEVALERARLALYELDCDGAATILARPELQKSESGEQLADIVRGCQRVTAALVTDTDEARHIEIRWQDEHDRALAPFLFDTVGKARDALTRDLGVDWPLPTRIVVVRDLLSLSAMTGLPYKSAQTTGTVAVAKWGRVTLLSPRASLHGYSWRDTVAHELTHLAVTRASRDRAPLWLQEGIAKREETRWRDPGPFDDRPPADAVVQRGIELGLALPLDKLGPSIAMLPSADAAMVAFAEVTSFVRFYAQNAGDEALPKLLAELRNSNSNGNGTDSDQALLSASGVDRKTWDVRWRAYIASRPRDPLPALFGLADPNEADPFGAGAPKDKPGATTKPGATATTKSRERMRDLRDRTRLAELLLSRDTQYADAALLELDRIEMGTAILRPGPQTTGVIVGDPSALWVRARALEEAGRRTEGEPLVADPRVVLTSYGPWWAIRGRWARLSEDEPTAAASFLEALGADPFDPEAACETVDPHASPPDAKKQLCDAARARAEPPFGD
jgi:hypothetical protein